MTDSETAESHHSMGDDSRKLEPLSFVHDMGDLSLAVLTVGLGDLSLAVLTVGLVLGLGRRVYVVSFMDFLRLVSYLFPVP